MTKKKKRAIDLYANISIVILTVISVIWMFFFGSNSDLNASGATAFKYFTVDSNILLAVTSAFTVVYRLNRRKYELGRALYTFKFIGVVSVTITFLCVIFILLPLGFSPKSMFLGPNLIFHIINPIIAIISFSMFESCSNVCKRLVLHGLLAPMVYTIIILPLVGMKIIVSPYPFMDINTISLIESFFTFIVMTASMFVISYVIYAINVRLSK